MSKILIIGGTGNIGRSLVQSLHESQKDFVVLVRNSQKQKELEDQGIKCVAGDYTNLNEVKMAMSEIQRLFLLVAANYNMDQHEKDIIDLARNNGIQHIVNISAVAVTEDPQTRLGICHARTEEALVASGIQYTILRPHSFMQNMLGNLPSIKDHGGMYGTIEDVAIPMIDARDIGEAAARILIDPHLYVNQTILLTGPQSISHSEAAQIISDVTGLKVNYINIPDEAAKSAMTNVGMPEWLVKDLITLNNLWKSGEDIDVTSDLEMILGHSARTFDTFISDHKFLFS